MSAAAVDAEQRRLLRDVARRLVAEEAPGDAVKDWDHRGVYPEALYGRIADLGWYEIAIADEHAGARATLLGDLCEELGRASSDLVALFNLTASGLGDLQAWGTEEQRERLIPAALAGELRFSIAVSEPDVGSDAAAVRTTADPAPDGGFVLNGQKAYCEAAGLPATWICVYARTARGGRKRDAISAFLVPAEHPGVRLRRMPALGRNISGIYEVFLEDVHVPPSGLLGALGDGWRILKRRLVLERILISFGFVGSAAAVIDMTARYARERRQFGRPIGAFQGVAHPLAELYVRLDAARCALRRTTELYDAGQPCELESTMAKYLTGQLYAETSSTAMVLHGAYGYVRDHTLPMHHSDGIIARVVAGPPQIGLNVVARHLGLEDERP